MIWEWWHEHRWLIKEDVGGDSCMVSVCDWVEFEKSVGTFYNAKNLVQSEVFFFLPCWNWGPAFAIPSFFGWSYLSFSEKQRQSESMMKKFKIKWYFGAQKRSHVTLSDWLCTAEAFILLLDSQDLSTPLVLQSSSRTSLYHFPSHNN